MPLYHIELRTQDRIWDTLKIERDDMDALRVELSVFVGDLLKEHAQKIWLDQDWRVDVTDHRGLILYVLHIFATDSAAVSAPRR